MAAYMIICQKHSVIFVLDKFHAVDKRLMAYCDASKKGDVESQFEINFEDCVNAIDRAVSYRMYRYKEFDVRAYKSYSDPLEGDMNWIFPG